MGSNEGENEFVQAYCEAGEGAFKVEVLEGVVRNDSRVGIEDDRNPEIRPGPRFGRHAMLCSPIFWIIHIDHDHGYGHDSITQHLF